MSATGTEKASPAASPVQAAHDRQVIFKAACKEANAFRGAVIGHFANFEFSAGTILALASAMPEYATVAKKPAHLVGHKIEQVRKIAETDGPLKNSADGIIANLDALRRYEKTRHFMAHAKLEIVQTKNEKPLYLFHLTRPGQGSTEDSCMVVSKESAKSILSTLEPIVEKLTRQLDVLGKLQQAKIEHLPVATAAPQCRTV